MSRSVSIGWAIPLPTPSPGDPRASRIADPPRIAEVIAANLSRFLARSEIQLESVDAVAFGRHVVASVRVAGTPDPDDVLEAVSTIGDHPPEFAWHGRLELLGVADF